MRVAPQTFSKTTLAYGQPAESENDAEQHYDETHISVMYWIDLMLNALISCATYRSDSTIRSFSAIPTQPVLRQLDIPIGLLADS